MLKPGFEILHRNSKSVTEISKDGLMTIRYLVYSYPHYLLPEGFSLRA